MTGTPIKPCEFCGKMPRETPPFYHRNDILMQTPQSVWKEYYKSGYSLRDAVKMELSYV